MKWVSLFIAVVWAVLAGVDFGNGRIAPGLVAAIGAVTFSWIAAREDAEQNRRRGTVRGRHQSIVTGNVRNSIINQTRGRDE